MHDINEGDLVLAHYCHRVYYRCSVTRYPDASSSPSRVMWKGTIQKVVSVDNKYGYQPGDTIALSPAELYPLSPIERLLYV